MSDFLVWRISAFNYKKLKFEAGKFPFYQWIRVAPGGGYAIPIRLKISMQVAAFEFPGVS
jgi:hypothetical protein